MQSAWSSAAEKSGLTIGLSLDRDPTEADRQAMHVLGTALFLVPGLTPWQDMELLWQGEGCVLAAHPAMRFTKGWDHALVRALTYCQKTVGHRAALTGYLPRAVDPVDAVYPVAAERIDRRSLLHFRRGTPLRYAMHPVPSAFLNPDFCFAPATFFRAMAREEGPLFLRAFRCRWDLYTLHQPVIHTQWDMEINAVSLRGLAEDEGVSRFEARTGTHLAERQLSPRVRCGILTPDMTFETRVPTATRLQEALRNLDNRATSLDPLCVTAWLSVPQVTLDEPRMICFRRLSAMKNLPLLCYTDPANSGRIGLSHGVIQEYKRYYGLSVPDDVLRADLLNYVKLCKPFLLQRTRQNSLRYSHYLWLNFDYLTYPAYEKAALDWETVCRDRIMLALVNGRPDTGMISVPEDRLEPLCAEITRLVKQELDRGFPLPQEKSLWTALMRLHPDWFEVVPLPGKHELLALTMTGRGEEFHTR